jgi:hypothetical protein
MFTTPLTGECPSYQPFASNCQGLHVLPAGFRPAGPAEILASTEDAATH